MNSKQIIKSVIVMMGLASAPVFAGASQEFKNNCKATTAQTIEGVKLTKYFSDTNTNEKGIYIVSTTGGVWIIPGAQNYPDNYLADEMRKIAMAAVLSDTKVNLCASGSSTPNKVWAIELDTD
ncbi:Heat-labile enterotoxin IIA, B chain [Escherichia coli]|uniref:Heat-labile enterotoxin IIA, B chain n=1 Tax=Escherichia coli TaxID=562 RepID=UPI001CD175EA|nr:Heat-labile enterotoxin IIA, B chain [Escherichia coli]EKQ3387585.1 Heat-labile enterotoxin IIA, B chain [Escherichia coli]ELR7144648.1 Heat-labile enterotoxin IIA, B chain [Escherichia coli]